MNKTLVLVLALLCGPLFAQHHIITAVNNPADGGLIDGLVPLEVFGGVDFETGNLADYAFDNSSSDYPWMVWSNAHAGGYCMASANNGHHNTDSYIEMTVDFATEGYVRFYSRVSSQKSGDQGKFFVDGTQWLEEAGTNGPWGDHFFEVSAGTHTFRWLYHKNGSVNAGEDRYYVDDIAFGLANYTQGHLCTLTATAQEGYAFVNWTENGAVVSTDPVYSFDVTCGRSLTANYRYADVNLSYGALAGIFSVSADEQVRFSKGNLQYIGSADAPYWKFAEHQWDCLDLNAQTGASPLANRDRFGWGTSGYDHGAVCYQPWSNSAFYGDYFAYGQFDCDLCDQSGKADWGYNPVLNGGDIVHLWRTLKNTEWLYLFRSRTTASGILYAKANVNNVNGVVLLPDDWNESYYPLNNTNQGNANYNTNVINSLQWDILEAHGAVFLPAEGTGGSYWSASYENTNEACRVEFGNGYLYPNEVDLRSSRQSVRLVCALQPTVGHTLHLENGWKWFSSFVEYGADALSELENSIGASEVATATIKSQTGVRMYENGNWYSNTLTTLENENMYMAQLDAALDVTLTGPIANPEEHPVTLPKGWKWIGFMSPTSMSLANALSNLTPHEDDIIKGQNGFATYSGTAWAGSLKSLEPGKGYMYQNTGDEAVTLVYPVAGKGCGMAEEAALQWKSNPAKYARNMSLMISLDGMDLAEGSHEIGAFVNGECRGSALIQRVEGIDTPLAFLTVCGEENDVVSFKVYDVKAGKALESSVKERIVFTADVVFGSLRHPYLLHVSGCDGDTCAVSVVARAGEHGDELVVAE